MPKYVKLKGSRCPINGVMVNVGSYAVPRYCGVDRDLNVFDTITFCMMSVVFNKYIYICCCWCSITIKFNKYSKNKLLPSNFSS